MHANLTSDAFFSFNTAFASISCDYVAKPVAFTQD